ncbi:MAG: M1 family metallopeptidase [Planctomycetota bacterium]
MKTLRTKTRLVPGLVALAAALCGATTSLAQERVAPPDRFRQLEEVLPTPNEVRSASGAPGHRYWQQRADHVIDVQIDDARQHLTATQSITYTNRSPDTLRYLWLQLDQNIFEPHADGRASETAPNFDEFSYDALQRLLALEDFAGGMRVTAVRGARGEPLPHVVVRTMMRVDLPSPLAPGSSVTFSVDWNYAINDAKKIRARSGYEYFEKDDNYLYEIAQWFPRMAAYTDVNGWQHKQFVGSGEFTLEFGDYLVRITVPADHVVAATGVLQNPEDVLTPVARERLASAERAERPVFVVTPEEAKANESSRATATKTWIFRAQNVRDFAFASSRKFIWDAQRHHVAGQRVLAMSFYPNEGEPLWSRYSTQAIIHTLDVYSRYTFTYPYPVAISVNGPVGGMEYPMICFNGPRPEEDGTYSKRTKYGLISVIIHEVGHNYFPMIVNSDERQWTWMDEGLNTFVQFLAEQEWERDYPSRRGEPQHIVEFMKSENQVPIMTNSESLLQFGNNAYAKPATALNILRETILGRELFDFAFREYAQRWMFKRPQPADFFRTMEDASAVDLDWFWRGWFYSTDAVDIAIEAVRLYTLDTLDPDIDKPRRVQDREREPVTRSEERNRGLVRRADLFAELNDFYNDYDELDVTEKDREKFRKILEDMKPEEIALLSVERRFYALDFENKGGLVMPVILEITYADGSQEELRLPAEIWRRNPQRVSRLVMTTREITSIVVDPHLETADVDLTNNHWPRRPIESRFKLFRREKEKNPMQDALPDSEAKASPSSDGATKPEGGTTTSEDGRAAPVVTPREDLRRGR